MKMVWSIFFVFWFIDWNDAHYLEASYLKGVWLKINDEWMKLDLFFETHAKVRNRQPSFNYRDAQIKE